MDAGAGGELEGITIRHSVTPADGEAVVRLHREVYSREYGFDESFAAYVGGPLQKFLASRDDRGRLWLAERAGRLVGCIAIVPASEREAQLRWYVVDSGARGLGLGGELMQRAVAFCRDSGYERVFLWTVSVLEAAARRYRAVGFVRAESKPVLLWGVDLVEERYVFEVRQG